MLRWVAGLGVGRTRSKTDRRTATQPEENGWQLTFHVFDYNQDFFELGTTTDPSGGSPTAGAPKSRAPRRRPAGLWGNHGYEAKYVMA